MRQIAPNPATDRSGNPSPKLAITVDPEAHARLVAAAEAEGVSVSAA
jgi:predicted HicB family RNase H-like nuclease